MRAAKALGLALALAGCALAPQTATGPLTGAATGAATARGAQDALPPMRTFRAGPPPVPVPANQALAQDFMDLHFRLESGARLAVFTRYEAPIRVAVRGPATPLLERDLDDLLARLRREAGLDVARAPPREANVTVEVVPWRTMRRLVPQAACFVVPNVASWAEYRRARLSPLVDWARVERRERTAIFIPDAIPPQEVRDCLHEELAQALGPLNDLWRLPGSVFNDDNFHSVLTPADMLVLRATYAPELATGLSEREVAALLPAVLARLHPAGGRASPVGARTPSRAYQEAIDAALDEGREDAFRRAAAVAAGRLAQGEAAAEGFAAYVLGRILLTSDLDAAARAFDRAAAIYAPDPRTAVHAAHVGLQQAALALRLGDGAQAAAIGRAHRGAAEAAQNAALLALLGLVEAEALDGLGRSRAARARRLDSLGWARYGFGPDDAVRDRLGEVARLARRPAKEPGV